MKRYFLIFLSVLLISVLLLGSCGEPETTTPTTTTPTSTQPTETKPTTTTPEPPPGPESGGTLRIIAATGLVDLGWPPAMNPTDESTAKAYTEALVAWGADGDFMPELAESWDPKHGHIWMKRWIDTHRMRKAACKSSLRPFR